MIHTSRLSFVDTYGYINTYATAPHIILFSDRFIFLIIIVVYMDSHQSTRRRVTHYLNLESLMPKK